MNYRNVTKCMVAKTDTLICATEKEEERIAAQLLHNCTTTSSSM